MTGLLRTLACVVAVAVTIPCSRGEAPAPAANDPVVIPRMLADARSLDAISFAQVVEAATGKKVIPVDGARHGEDIEKISHAIDRVLTRLRELDHSIHNVSRINEASRYIEEELHTELNKIPDWECSIPLTAGGSAQRAGYPDLLLKTPKAVYYLDPKLVASGSETSSLRTFYYEPREATSKIQDDAVHLLVGVTHDGWSDGELQFAGWKLVDLESLPVRLKAEFQSNNRELYSEDRVVAESEDASGSRQ